MFFLGSNQCFLTEPSVKFSLTALLENTDYNAKKTRQKQDKSVLAELKCSFAVLAWFAYGVVVEFERRLPGRKVVNATHNRPQGGGVIFDVFFRL